MIFKGLNTQSQPHILTCVWYIQSLTKMYCLSPNYLCIFLKKIYIFTSFIYFTFAFITFVLFYFGLFVQLFAYKVLKVFKKIATASRELTSGHVTDAGYEVAAGGQHRRNFLPTARERSRLHSEPKYIYCEYCDQNTR